MQFEKSLLTGRFIRRYKRFFADVELSGMLEVAHVPNTGSLKGCAIEGLACLVSKSNNPERKLKYTLEAIESQGGGWVGVNTSWPNKLLDEAFEQKIFPHWREFLNLQREIKISKDTRLDAVLTRDHYKHYIEVKNVTMKEGESALFPDAVTERGQKHLRELMKLVQEGHSAEILFTVQRTDCSFFSPAYQIDPKYSDLLLQADRAGVKVTVAVVQVTPDRIEMTGEILPLRWPQ